MSYVKKSRKDFLKSLVYATGAAAIPPLGSVRGDSLPGESSADVVAVDEYDFRVRLQVPQVIDNMTSQGYRAYRQQTISGPMFVNWLSGGKFSLEFDTLVNSNFKVRGANVTYATTVLPEVSCPRFVYIGSNRTNKFTKASIGFYAQLCPSYAIGEPEEDNSFYLMFAGRGVSCLNRSLDARVVTRLSGYAAGMQGCSCTAYGHKSPTRNAGIIGPTEVVNDVVSSFGMWRATWKSRIFS